MLAWARGSSMGTLDVKRARPAMLPRRAALTIYSRILGLHLPSKTAAPTPPISSPHVDPLRQILVSKSLSALSEHFKLPLTTVYSLKMPFKQPSAKPTQKIDIEKALHSDDKNYTMVKVDDAKIEVGFIYQLHQAMDSQTDPTPRSPPGCRQPQRHREAMGPVDCCGPGSQHHLPQARRQTTANMRGRSKAGFRKCDRELLQWNDHQLDKVELERIKNPSKTAADHTHQANRLTNVARRMKVNSRRRDDPVKGNCNLLNTISTMKAYQDLADGKHLLCQDRPEDSEDQPQDDRQNGYQVALTSDDIGSHPGPQADVQAMTQREDRIKQHCKEIVELFQAITDVKIDNILHTAKISRLAEQHTVKAKQLRSMIKAEANRLTGETIADKKRGMKAISTAIGNSDSKPLRFRQKRRGSPRRRKERRHHNLTSRRRRHCKTRLEKGIYDGVANKHAPHLLQTLCVLSDPAKRIRSSRH